MVEHQMPMPNGKTAPHKFSQNTLDASAKALGLITTDKGKDGIWWSLPDAAGAVAGQ